MEHDQAIAAMAAERYTLGELGPEERDHFEEHFFQCDECAQDVLDLASVAQGAKDYLHPQRKPDVQEAGRGRLGWFAGWMRGWAWAPALLALLLFAGYDDMRLRHDVRPQSVVSATLQPEARGETTAIPAERLGAFLLLEADLPGSSGNLQWDLRKADSKEALVRDAAPAPPPGESFKVLLPSSSLPPADYTLTVRQPTVFPEKTWLFRFRVASNLR